MLTIKWQANQANMDVLVKLLKNQPYDMLMTSLLPEAPYYAINTHYAFTKDSSGKIIIDCGFRNGNGPTRFQIFIVTHGVLGRPGRPVTLAKNNPIRRQSDILLGRYPNVLHYGSGFTPQEIDQLTMSADKNPMWKN